MVLKCHGRLRASFAAAISLPRLCKLTSSSNTLTRRQPRHYGPRSLDARAEPRHHRCRPESLPQHIPPTVKKRETRCLWPQSPERAPQRTLALETNHAKNKAWDMTTSGHTTALLTMALRLAFIQTCFMYALRLGSHTHLGSKLADCGSQGTTNTVPESLSRTQSHAQLSCAAREHS